MNKKTQIAFAAAAAGAATIVGAVAINRNAPKQTAFYTCASDTTGNNGTIHATKCDVRGGYNIIGTADKNGNFVPDPVQPANGADMRIGLATKRGFENGSAQIALSNDLPASTADKETNNAPKQTAFYTCASDTTGNNGTIHATKCDVRGGYNIIGTADKNGNFVPDPVQPANGADMRIGLATKRGFENGSAQIALSNDLPASTADKETNNAPKQTAFYTCASDTTGNNGTIHATKCDVRGGYNIIGTADKNGNFVPDPVQPANGADMRIGLATKRGFENGSAQIALSNDLPASTADKETNSADLSFRGDTPSAQVYNGGIDSDNVACRKDPAFSKGCGANFARPQ